MPVRSERFFLPALLVLAAAGTAFVVDHQRLDSATIDEPFHAFAAAEYVLGGTSWSNLEHPPLTKILAGASLGAAGARAPRLPKPFDLRASESPVAWATAPDNLPTERLLSAARRPFPVLFFALVVATGLVARHAAGKGAGLGAALLVAFEPTGVAHAAFVHTDVASALGWVVTLALATAALERESAWRAAATGLALGLSLGAKFSCVLLVPVLVLLALVRALHHPRRARIAGGVAAAAAIALAVVAALYAFTARRMSAAEEAASVELHFGLHPPAAGTASVVRALGHFSPALARYAAGLAGIAGQSLQGHGLNYLRGRVSPEGFPSYFFEAFAVKSATAFLALLVVAALLAAWRRVRPGPLDGAALLATGVLFVTTAGSAYNIGVRHVLPAYPLLAIAAAAAIARALPAHGVTALLAGAGLVQLLETAVIHPHEISFFNALAGGPSRGREWLTDSNLDWGQDWTRLRLRLARDGTTASTRIAPWSPLPPPVLVPGAPVFRPLAASIPPGRWAVSTFAIDVLPELLAFRGSPDEAAGFARLREAIRTRGEPEGRVGYSILLYRIREEALPLP